MKETENRNFELILIEEDKLLNEMILKSFKFNYFYFSKTAI